MIIYKATNLINGKVYIGQTTKTLTERMEGHIEKAGGYSQTYFQRSIIEHGVDNFKWEVICICPNIDSLNEQEQYYIALYDSMNNGYNRTSGGVYYKMSDARKEEIRQTKLKYWHNQRQL
ncbi:MAG: GIY-YIG nuclease family protein [Candidatus Neomarinimicrobiota bacterium]